MQIDFLLIASSLYGKIEIENGAGQGMDANISLSDLSSNSFPEGKERLSLLCHVDQAANDHNTIPSADN